jgi:hypothetical protein
MALLQRAPNPVPYREGEGLGDIQALARGLPKHSHCRQEGRQLPQAIEEDLRVVRIL